MKPHVLKLRNCPLHYWLNDADGPVVVFTHGMKMDHRMFELQIESVIDAGYRLLLWDVRGHGRSRPIGDTFTITQAAEDLRAILDHAGIDQVILMGHSMGGFISQEFAFRYPHRAAAMFILGSLCITQRQQWFVHFNKPISRLAFFLCPSPVMYWLAGRVAGKSQWARQNARQIARQVPRKDFLEIWRAITNCDHEEPGYRPAMPMMITHGRQDYWVGLGLIKWLSPQWAASIPQCRYAMIPDAGHNACGDNPAYFNTLLLDFLGGLPETLG